MQQVKDGPEDEPAVDRWWMICRSIAGGVEAMTLPCFGGKALALFGHEEKAKIFLWSVGSELSRGGWWIRESRCGEVASVLCGPCVNVQRVTLDPPPMAAGWTVTLASVDRDEFLAHLLARKGAGQGAGPQRALRAAPLVPGSSTRRRTMRREKRARTWVARGERDL